MHLCAQYWLCIVASLGLQCTTSTSGAPALSHQPSKQAGASVSVWTSGSEELDGSLLPIQSRDGCSLVFECLCLSFWYFQKPPRWSISRPTQRREWTTLRCTLTTRGRRSTTRRTTRCTWASTPRCQATSCTARWRRHAARVDPIRKATKIGMSQANLYIYRLLSHYFSQLHCRALSFHTEHYV